MQMLQALIFQPSNVERAHLRQGRYNGRYTDLRRQPYNHTDRKKVNPDIAAFTSLRLFFSIFLSFKTSSWNGYQPVFSYGCQIGFALLAKVSKLI